jgi:hypothetical protein
MINNHKRRHMGRRKNVPAAFFFMLPVCRCMGDNTVEEL